MARTFDERKKSGKGFCEDCEWFNFLDDNDATPQPAGYCRRYPPSFKLDDSWSDGFPNVRLTDWCGEWVSRS
jgi:hypothetical protein